MNPHSEFDVRMEQAYARAIEWAKENQDPFMLHKYYAGLENHRRWMKERAG
jgi:hypothetical protein